MASESLIMHVKDLDSTSITYGPPRALMDSMGKSVPIYYRGHPLVIQTEEMRIPFGIRDGLNGDNAAQSSQSTQVRKKSLEFSVEKDVAPLFFARISEMDATVIDHAMRHSKHWFRKAHDSRDVLEALYSPMIKHARDKVTGEISTKYAPLFKANLIVKPDGSIGTEVYDSKRRPVDVASNDLRGLRGIAILQCSGVWIAGGKFGVAWRALQLRVSGSSSAGMGQLPKFAFIADDVDQEWTREEPKLDDDSKGPRCEKAATEDAACASAFM